MSTESFDFLFNTHYKDIFHYCYHLVKNEQDADELACETFVKAFFNLKKFDPHISGFSTWIFGIAHNLSVDFLRSASYRRKKQTCSLDDEVAEIIDPIKPDEKAEKKQLLQFITECLEILETDVKTAFILYFLKGLSYQQIVKILRKNSRSSVKHLIDKGKKRMKRCLEKKGVDDNWNLDDKF
jgi:RNA polymerase sigma-70 factor, ECF subfamily